jgi:hypothetical protein
MMSALLAGQTSERLSMPTSGIPILAIGYLPLAIRPVGRPVPGPNALVFTHNSRLFILRDLVHAEIKFKELARLTGLGE